MQDKNSRRNFLGIAAATVAAAGCFGRSPAPTPANSTPPGPPAAPADEKVPRDKAIAGSFLFGPKKFTAYASDTDIVAAVNIYGLAMMDSAHDIALLPNTKDFNYPGTEEELPEHHPLLWAGIVPESTDIAPTRDGKLYWWDLTGKTVTFEWWNASERVDEHSMEGNLRGSDRHPWSRSDVITRTCNHAGTSIMAVGDRENEDRVATYVKFGRSDVILSPPWSAAGSVGEWQLKVSDRKGGWREVGSVRALSDNVTVIRKRPSGASRFRIAIKAFSAPASDTKYITYRPTDVDAALLLALTHASTHARRVAVNTLRDMYAFARVTKLAKADYDKFPIAEFVRGIRGETDAPVGGAFLSDDDGHCTFVQE